MGWGQFSATADKGSKSKRGALNNDEPIDMVLLALELGASFVALNPLHAIHNRRPFNTSPYLPNSVFYQNFIYLDIEGIDDFQNSRRARRLWSELRSTGTGYA